LNKKIVGIGIGAAVAIAAVFLIIIPQLQPSTIAQNISQTQTANIPHNIKFGLVIIPPTQKSTLQQVKDAYTQAASTGIGRSNVYLSWPIMEPSQGAYNWAYSDILMGLNREQHLNVTLYFSVINNQNLGPFPNWMGNPQLDQKLQDQTVTTLDAILSRYYIVDYVIIGGNILMRQLTRYTMKVIVQKRKGLIYKK
jgi:GH35 family endo-1,4-beta-xylanase